eukprot:gene1205-1221_t
MKVGLVTKEWPPFIYGGAGVHVKYLAKSLRELVDVDVHCFGEDRPDAVAYQLSEAEQKLNPAMQALITDAQIASNLEGVDIVHSHTWYANMAGHWAKILYKIPHVISAHSLEPDRPWKEEQIGGGYRISSWAEKTAYESADAIIAVSQGMRRDVLKAYPALDPNKVHAILNGIDTDTYYPQANPELLESLNIKGPYAIFVGRITRQKGLAHLLKAWKEVDPQFGLVLCAGSPDEPGIGAEVQAAIEELQAVRDNVIWISKMAPQADTAVLASDVGGIPEVVADGVTGELIHYDGNAPEFEAAFAKKINELITVKPDEYAL